MQEGKEYVCSDWSPKARAAALCAALSAPIALLAQSANQVEVQIHADQVTSHVSPLLYGLMTEEINYSYDGGLYGELVRNRDFKEDAKEPVHWQLVQERGASGSMSLDSNTRRAGKSLPSAGVRLPIRIRLPNRPRSCR